LYLNDAHLILLFFFIDLKSDCIAGYSVAQFPQSSGGPIKLGLQTTYLNRRAPVRIEHTANVILTYIGESFIIKRNLIFPVITVCALVARAETFHRLSSGITGIAVTVKFTVVGVFNENTDDLDEQHFEHESRAS
jgi:hypothetical protein